GLVAPGRLQVAVRVGAEPHVAPGRRHRERAEAGDGAGVVDGPAAGVEEGEAAAAHPTGQARLVVGDVPEAGGRGVRARVVPVAVHQARNVARADQRRGRSRLRTVRVPGAGV